MQHSQRLSTALRAARAAEEVIRRYYQGQFEIELKADQSPVTVADVEAETIIKGIILEAFPDHGFFGEETGKENPDAEFTWLIDPIDGTKSFVRGYPFFSTQIALMQGDELVLGVSNAPLFDELAYAEKGKGAFINDVRVKVSELSEFSQVTLSLGNISTLAAGPRWAKLGELVGRVNRVRGYGDFYHYHLLAAGKADLVVESDVNILDIAALSVLIHEAGGVFTDLEGQPLTLDTRSVLAAATPTLHQATLELLQA